MFLTGNSRWLRGCPIPQSQRPNAPYVVTGGGIPGTDSGTSQIIYSKPFLIHQGGRWGCFDSSNTGLDLELPSPSQAAAQQSAVPKH
jgi:hypothetical protein